MSWELYILGANSAVPTRYRYPSGQVLNLGSQSILIDCGEGSQLRMLEYGIKTSRIETILISHLHGDHIYGLPGLLTSYNLFGRNTPLKIIGPSGIKSYIDHSIGITNHEFKYPVEIQEITSTEPETILDTSSFLIRSFPLVHRVPTYGYKIEEKLTRIYLSKEKIQHLQLTDEQVKYILNNGSIDIKGQPYNLANLERTPTPCSYAYVSDTTYFPECAQSVGPVRFMYHEATFLDIDHHQAKKRFHSTAREAAQTARDSPADHLLLGHYSSRYTDLEQFRSEAETVFKPVSLALSGKKFTIPQEGEIIYNGLLTKSER